MSTVSRERSAVSGWRRAAPLALALLCAGAGRAAAMQDSVVRISPEATPDSTGRNALPPTVVQELLRFYNDSSTTRIVGGFQLPAGARFNGPLAVFRGSLRISGEVTGRVTVINGDLIIDAGAHLAGDMLVVGGQILVREGARVEGRQRAYPVQARLIRTGNGLLGIPPPSQTLGDLASARARITTGHFRTDLLIGTGRTYNRVEGLPIMPGLRVTREGLRDVEGRLDLGGIVWTSPDQTDRRAKFGYTGRVEFRFGLQRRLTIGGRVYRQVLPIEEQPLSRNEAGWSAFLLQRDYRDFYQVQGVAGYASYFLGSGLTASTSLRYDAERSVPANDPISLFRNTAWRPNPLVDDGHYTTWRVGLDLDTRNEPVSPTSGWLMQTYWEHTGSNDAAPLSLPTEVRDPIAPGRFGSSRIMFDVRRYARLNQSVRVAARVVGGGWISGDPLPVQRRLALGGPDILPGYEFRSFSCAPASLVDPSQTGLCDRMLAAQLELRTRTHIGLPLATSDPYITGLQRLLAIREPDIVIFGDLGKSWITGEGPGRVPNDRLPVLREWGADIGFGFDAGGLGFYLAQPLTGGRPLLFSVRLQRRF
jgi:hypothetical protein